MPPRPWIALAVVVVAACGEHSITYHQDVRPLLERRCISCHAYAPTQRVDLMDYESIAPLAGLVAHTAEDRLMPLTAVRADGSCQRFPDVPWLSEFEVELLDEWADHHGAAEGDPNDPRHAEPPPTPPALRHVSATLDTAEEYTPDLGEAALRCFVVDPGNAADAFLTALEVRPSEDWNVRQVTLYTLDSAESEAAAEARADEDAVPGYACYGGPGVAGARLLIGWSWVGRALGSAVMRLPDDTGLRVPGGRRLVLQVHYNLILGIRPDRTQIDLELEPSVAQEVAWFEAGPDELTLPAGQQRVEVGGDDVVEAATQVLGIYPRMRAFALEQRVRTGGLSSTCLAETEKWDFHGLQHLYRYETPVPLAAGERVRVDCSYTTENQTEPVTTGEGPTDEECHAYLLVTTP